MYGFGLETAVFPSEGSLTPAGNHGGRGNSLGNTHGSSRYHCLHAPVMTVGHDERPTITGTLAW